MTYNSLLCLNGDLPERGFFRQFELPVIAADGAANKLYELGIVPSVVIGDLDSLRVNTGVPLICIEDQNQCDYQKAMAYLERHKLLPTIVLGMSGGELDHILNNISVFMSYPSHNNLFFAPPVYGMLLCQGSHQFGLPLHTKISLMGLPEAIVTTGGLEWELKEQKMCFPGFNSCLNRMRESILTINVIRGTVLLLAHDIINMGASSVITSPRLA